MQFSVIIPTCNRTELLSKCLDLLEPEYQSIQSGLFEVIVTDDGTDGSAAIMIKEKYPWAKWVAGPRRGPARNRNNGAQFASGDWLVFVDDDVLPDKELLNIYSCGINEYPQSLAFEGAILPDNWKLLEKDMTECPVNTTGGYFWSANICVQRFLFNNIKGFDETFLIAAQEDQDFYLAVKKETFVPFLKDAIVVHPVRHISLPRKIRGIQKETHNWLKFVAKHRPQDISTAINDNFIGHLKIAVKKLARLQFKWFTYHVFCSVYGFTLVVRKKRIMQMLHNNNHSSK